MSGVAEGKRGHCISCGRYAGPIAICPYCDESLPVAPGIMWLRRLALLLAVGGLVVLFYATQRHEIPRIYCSAISPSMNFATVHVRGIVTQAPYVREVSGEVVYVAFTVSDGTGSIRVQVSEPLAAHISIPAECARLDLVGRLDLRANQPPRLRLRRMQPVRGGPA